MEDSTHNNPLFEPYPPDTHLEPGAEIRPSMTLCAQCALSLPRFCTSPFLHRRAVRGLDRPQIASTGPLLIRTCVPRLFKFEPAVGCVYVQLDGGIAVVVLIVRCVGSPRITYDQHRPTYRVYLLARARLDIGK